MPSPFSLSLDLHQNVRFESEIDSYNISPLSHTHKNTHKWTPVSLSASLFPFIWHVFFLPIPAVTNAFDMQNFQFKSQKITRSKESTRLLLPRISAMHPVLELG
ncbi:hypothetical protein ACJIZ3_003157 [Penstemon smallii]|uniref:Uncharacterized protein n=1 Tax=Penstemon smallii TaxID=265156 RepID=A0ABD3U8F4_9LAMI